MTIQSKGLPSRAQRWVPHWQVPRPWPCSARPVHSGSLTPVAVGSLFSALYSASTSASSRTTYTPAVAATAASVTAKNSSL